MIYYQSMYNFLKHIPKKFKVNKIYKKINSNSFFYNSINGDKLLLYDSKNSTNFVDSEKLKNYIKADRDIVFYKNFYAILYEKFKFIPKLIYIDKNIILFKIEVSDNFILDNEKNIVKDAELLKKLLSREYKFTIDSYKVEILNELKKLLNTTFNINDIDKEFSSYFHNYENKFKIEILNKPQFLNDNNLFYILNLSDFYLKLIK